MLIESLQYIVIPTTDLKKSLEFYNELLDFEIVEETNAKGALLQFDKINFQLLTVESHEPSSQPLFSCILDIDDFTDALQELDENDVKVASGPSAIEKGEHVLVEDPSGNIVEFFYTEG